MLVKNWKLAKSLKRFVEEEESFGATKQGFDVDWIVGKSIGERQSGFPNNILPVAESEEAFSTVTVTAKTSALQ